MSWQLNRTAGCVLLLLFVTLDENVWIPGLVAAHEGDIALYHGQNRLEGTVYVLHRGRWGPVCDDNWTLKEAHVVCRQLGHAAAVAAFRGDKFGSDDGGSHYMLDDVYCNGDEGHLMKCSFWSDHDCTRAQHAGVRCMKMTRKRSKDGTERNSPAGQYDWNPLGLHASVDTMLQWRKETFEIHHEPIVERQADNDQRISKKMIILASVGGVEGLVCPDHFGIPEGHVACKIMGFNYCQDVSKIENFSHLQRGKMRTVLHVGHCYGNETSFRDCHSYAHSGGVECLNKGQSISVRCNKELPDILTRARDVQQSGYLTLVPMAQILCAMEEKCFPESLYHLTSRYAKTEEFHRIHRKLLRFSSIVENIGTVDFIPMTDPTEWQWHACHSHFHSMEEFASYEIVNLTHHVVASGHKASFCLEDNICSKGSQSKYRCSTRKADKGSQGISPGCMDTYYHDYDCQWVDVTDVRPGKYKFQIITNPHFLVAEASFFNNGMECDLNLAHTRANLQNCHLKHPFDLFHSPGL